MTNLETLTKGHKSAYNVKCDVKITNVKKNADNSFTYWAIEADHRSVVNTKHMVYMGKFDMGFWTKESWGFEFDTNISYN